MSNSDDKPGMTRGGKIGLLAFFAMWIGFVVVWWFHQRPPAPALYVVNGLPVAVDIRVDDQTMHLDPSQFDFFAELPVGENEVVVTTSSGDPVSTETIELTRGHAMAVYNVLGAAFVHGMKVWYGFGISGEDPELELYVDEAFHAIPHERVQLRFEKPPERVTTELGSGDVYYRFVGVPEEGPWDWRFTVDMLREAGQGAAADAIQARVEAVAPDAANAAAP